MERLYQRDKAACARVCPPQFGGDCKVVCSRAAATNSVLRGKLFNVPFQQPPLTDLDTGTASELAWAALGASFARAPWRSPTAVGAAEALSGGDSPLPPPVVRAPECPATGSLNASFYGWGQVPDALFQPTFVAAPTEVFERAADVNQALSGYLINQPGPYLAPDGPLSAAAATAGTSAGQLPLANPFGGIGFNLSQDVPHNSLINNFGRPAYFPGADVQARRRPRIANLSA